MSNPTADSSQARTELEHHPDDARTRRTYLAPRVDAVLEPVTNYAVTACWDRTR